MVYRIVSGEQKVEMETQSTLEGVEKIPPSTPFVFGEEDADTGRPGDVEKKVEINQSWVVRDPSARDGRAGGKNRKTRQE
jgi:hypothetical protein